MPGPLFVIVFVPGIGKVPQVMPRAVHFLESDHEYIPIVLFEIMQCRPALHVYRGLQIPQNVRNLFVIQQG